MNQSLSVYNRGLHYGDGVFETIAIKSGRALLLNEHLNRLKSSCLRLKISGVDISAIKDEVLTLASTKDKAILKIIVTRGEGGRGYSSDNSTPAEKIILPYDWPSEITDHFTLRLCDLRLAHQPALAGIKHLNKLENVVARLEWDDPNIHEGLLCDSDQNIIEAISSNIFMVKNNIILTPILKNCGVDGVMRELVINIARQNDFQVEVREIPLNEFNNADEIFLTNSIIEIKIVTKFNKKIILSQPITKKLIKLVNNYDDY